MSKEDDFFGSFFETGSEDGEGDGSDGGVDEDALKAMAAGGFSIPGLPDLSKIGEHMEKFMGELSSNVEEATKRGVLSAFAELKDRKGKE